MLLKNGFLHNDLKSLYVQESAAKNDLIDATLPNYKNYEFLKYQKKREEVVNKSCQLPVLCQWLLGTYKYMRLASFCDHFHW